MDEVGASDCKFRHVVGPLAACMHYCTVDRRQPRGPMTMAPEETETPDHLFDREVPKLATRGGEWEPIKISLEIDPSAYIPKITTNPQT